MTFTFPKRNFVILLSSLIFYVSGARAQQSSAPQPSGTPAAVAAPGQATPHQATVPDKADKDAPKMPDTVPDKVPDIEEDWLLGHINKVPERKDELYEDWSKPALTPGMVSNVESLGVTEQNGFTRELLYAQWRELDPIDLWVVKPAGVKNPPVVLYLYSFPSSDERYKDPEFCKFVTAKGFAAVGFVSALTGHRFHDRPMREWFVSQLPEAMGATAHDVQMTLNYLEKRGDLDMTRVGIWGDGSGASIAILAAAVDPRIKVLDLLDPWGNWPEWLAHSSLIPENERHDYTTPTFLKAVENLDPVKWLPELKTQEVRLQYITDGLTITPVSVRERMEAAAPPHVKLTHYQNTKAFYTEVGATGKGFDWIKDRLALIAPAHGANNQSLTQATTQTKNSRR